MKVITKGQQPDIKVVTPAIGTMGDRCDRSMVGECDLDALLRRYSKEIAAWTPPVGDMVDTTVLPNDPVDAINVSRDILGSINKTEEAKTEEAKTEEAKTEEAKTEEVKTEGTKTEEVKENKDETSAVK